MKTSATKKTGKDETREPAPRPGSPDGKERSALWLQRYSLIAGQPFFQGLSTGQLVQLTDDALEMQFVPDQQIFREGSQANRFFLILEGKIVLESEAEDGTMIPIQTLGPGDDLGWSWLFPPFTLHFSARATEPTKAIFFYGTRLRERCEADHDLGYELMKRVAEVMVERLQATRRQLSESSDQENSRLKAKH
jgi:CRP-like cAMP-binding protein